jgi:4-hydroxy-tetrahydrodipicolinate reductase
MDKIRFAIAGAGGRMGRMLVESVLKAPDAQLAAALETPGNALLGKDAGEALGTPCGVAITDDIGTALAQSDCLIDFTRPEGTLIHLRYCLEHGVAMVVGTTGFTPEQRQQFEVAAKTIPIVLAPNMAVGVNAVFKLLDIAARILN